MFKMRSLMMFKMRSLSKIWQLVSFIGFYLKKLITSNLYLTYDIITPGFHMHPAIIKVPIQLRRPYEILTLISLVTMTPGTLSLDISADKESLYIHAMYVDNVDDFKKEIKQLEEKIHQLFNL